MFENTFFKIIKTIGPTKSPITPKNLKPVYIAIKVYIGCMPILLLTILGSINCLIAKVKIYNPINEVPRDVSLFIKDKIAHGIKTVPEPKYWKCINKAYN